MKQNMGITDRLIRIFISVAIGMLYYTKSLHGVFGYVFLALACLVFATAILGVCPLYSVLNISSDIKHKNV
jgi:hypothetical protein